MAVNYARLRNLNARQLISALIRDGFTLTAVPVHTKSIIIPTGRRVVVTFHAPSDTFAPKTLRSMIEGDARWTEDDLSA